MPRRQDVQHATEIVVTAGPNVEPEDVVRVGASFVIEVRIECASGCRIPSRTLVVRAPDETTRTVEVAEDTATAITLVAPTKPGFQTWTLSCVPIGHTVPSHAAAAIDWSHEIAPHTATLAVWGLPDTIPAGQKFSLKVGATSTAGPVLSRRKIEIRNAAGTTIAHTLLGNEPWPGTTALLWAELHATAPADPGIASWTAHLVADDASLAQEAFDCDFTIPVSAPPDHRVDIEVLEATTGVPVPDALVRIGAYRATTNDVGRAVLHVPKGNAEIVFWKTGYDAPDHPTEIDADKSVTIAATLVPEEDPDAHWKG